MDKRNHFFGMLVTESDLDGSFDWVEDADQNLAADTGMEGIHAGLVVSEQAVPDLTVQVTAGVATGPDGERIAVTAPTSTVDCAVDRYGTSTAVTVPGNEKYLAVYARFTRLATNPAVDDNGVTVYTRQYEAAEFLVEQGIEALIGAAVRPALLTDAVHLADVKLVNAQAAITNADITFTRRGDWLREVLTNLGGAAMVHGTAQTACAALWQAIDALAGVTGADNVGTDDYTTANAHVTWAGATVQDALEATADAIDGHIVGAAPNHPASAISTAIIAGTPESEAAPSEVQAVLANVFTHLNARTERATNETISGNWVHSGSIDAQSKILSEQSGAYVGSMAAGVHSPSMDRLNRYGSRLFGNSDTGSWGFPTDYVNRYRSTGKQFVEMALLANNKPVATGSIGPMIAALSDDGEIRIIEAMSGDVISLESSVLPLAHTWTSMCSDGEALYVIGYDGATMGKVLKLTYDAAAATKWAYTNAGGWSTNIGNGVFAGYPYDRICVGDATNVVVLCGNIACNVNGVIRSFNRTTGVLNAAWGAAGLARGTGSGSATNAKPTGGLVSLGGLSTAALKIIAFSTGETTIPGTLAGEVHFALLTNGGAPAAPFNTFVETIGALAGRNAAALDLAFDGHNIRWVSGSGVASALNVINGAIAGHTEAISYWNQLGVVGESGYGGACSTDGMHFFYVSNNDTADGYVRVGKISAHVRSPSTWILGEAYGIPKSERFIDQTGVSPRYDTIANVGRILCDGCHVWAISAISGARDTITRIPMFSIID